MRIGIGTIIVGLGIAGVASAGLVIDSETRDFKRGGEVNNGTVSIEGSNVAMNMNLGASSPTSVTAIYNGERDELISVQHAQRQYMVMNREAFKGVAQQMSAVQAQMRERMASMPAQQRAMVEKMMGTPPEPAALPDKKVVKTSHKDTINGWTCTRYDMMEDGAKTDEIWAATWEEVGIKKSDFQGFYDFADFQKEMMGSMKQSSKESTMDGFEKVDGFPVLIRHFSNGRLASETRMTGVNRKNLGADTFNPPAGYSPMQNPMGGMGRF